MQGNNYQCGWLK